jgi:hypothetical protein
MIVGCFGCAVGMGALFERDCCQCIVPRVVLSLQQQKVILRINLASIVSAHERVGRVIS